MRITNEILGKKGLNHSKVGGLQWCASYNLKRLMLGHK